jgi:hypothetical protein
MKTKEELEIDILNITMKINKEFPELSKYLVEMPNSGSKLNLFEISTENYNDYYNSLETLFSEYSKTHEMEHKKDGKDQINLPGYPAYPPSEDIYNLGIKEMELNPEDTSKLKTPNEEVNSQNEKDFEGNMSGDDLDIPGSNLDDQQESVGSEDEENNYYSLGGDAHDNLEEDNG